MFNRLIDEVIETSMKWRIVGTPLGEESSSVETWNRALISVCCTVAVLACAPADAKRRELSEKAAFTLPEYFDVSGGAIAPTGALLLWSRRRTELLIIDEQGSQRVVDVGSNEAPLAAAFVDNGVHLEVLFVPSGRVVRTDFSGHIIAERLLGQWLDSMVVNSAARTNVGWVTAGQDMAGNLVVAREAGVRGPQILKYLAFADYASTLPDTFARLAADLVAWQDKAIASLWWPPFESYIVGEAKGSTMRLRPRPSARSSDTDSSNSLLIARMALPIEHGFLQVLVDLKSDWRELVLFDDKGAELRRASINVAMGYVASAPERRELLAVRRGNQVEAVVYQWRWRR